MAADRREEVRQVLVGGPMTTRGIVRRVLGVTGDEPLPRGVITQVTYALLALERAGEVKRTTLSSRMVDWRLVLPPGPAGGD